MLPVGTFWFIWLYEDGQVTYPLSCTVPLSNTESGMPPSWDCCPVGAPRAASDAACGHCWCFMGLGHPYQAGDLSLKGLGQKRIPGWRNWGTKGTRGLLPAFMPVTVQSLVCGLIDVSRHSRRFSCCGPGGRGSLLCVTLRRAGLTRAGVESRLETHVRTEVRGRGPQGERRTPIPP